MSPFLNNRRRSAEVVAWTAAMLTFPVVLRAQAYPESVPDDVRLAVEALHLDENGIPAGYMVIEGDIIVPENFYEMGGPAATYTSRGDFWPGGNVPYVFDSGVSSTNRTYMLNAMAEWEAVANVDFFPRTNQSNYAYIQNGGGNNSFVGVQGGAQIINIVNWSSRFIVAHELNHCLGFWHEQSRADRGSYVTIDLSNVCQNCCSGGSCNHNFNVRPSGGGEYGPYDYDSVMHYGACSFSICSGCPNNGTCSNGGQTIFANNGTPIGQRDHLSRFDTLTTSFMYPYSNWRFAENSCRCTFLSICTPDGTFWCPYDGFQAGYDATPTNGGLWLPRSQTFSSAQGTYTKAMLIRAPLGALLR